MSKKTLNICTANISRGTTGFKRLLLPLPLRYHRALKFFGKQGVDLVAGQEFADGARNVFKDNKKWGVLSAKPNNVFRADTLRNVILHSRDSLRRIDWTNINTDMSGRRLGLNFPVGLYQVKATGETFASFSIHNPSAKTDVKARNEALKAQAEYAELLWNNGIPVLLPGDFNQGDAEKFFAKEVNARVGVQEGVDHILGIGFSFSNPEIHREAGVRGLRGFSDHPVLITKATPKIVCKEYKLPRVETKK